MASAKSKRALAPGHRVRVLIVDDSIAVRHLVTLALDNDPCVEVVGTASNGVEALERVTRLTPDVVTLDIEMPVMDGLEALQKIRHLTPQVRVIMLSRFTARGASETLEALALGADDYVTNLPTGGSVDESKARLRKDLSPKIKQFFSFSECAKIDEAHAIAPPTVAKMPAKDRILKQPDTAPQVVAIGVSTGGPTALSSIVHLFPQTFPLPILIVQHMPPLFTKLLCERLEGRAKLPVREAINHEPVVPGTILVAPGDYHMSVVLEAGDRCPRIQLDQTALQNSCRPAVDVLFESLATVYGGAVIAAVLTGMGHDGLRGAKLLRNAGASILAQDEQTSAVWGMPRAIAEAEIADAVVPLNEIVPAILQHCNRQQHPRGRIHA